MKRYIKKILFLSFLLLGSEFCFAGFAQSASFTPPFRDTAYSGKFVSQTILDPISITAGESKEVTVKIKNTGQKIWYRTGANYVSIYTVDPRYHASVFYGKGWIGKDQPARVTKDTKPGEVGEFIIKLYAPAKDSEYAEKFYLVAEDRTWIKGAYFFLKVKVSKGIAARAGAVSADGESGNAGLGNSGVINDTASEVVKEYRTYVAAFSSAEISARGGEQINFVARYVNDGGKKWDNYLWREAGSKRKGDLVISAYEPVNLADQSWISADKIIKNDEAVEPGQPAQINFVFRAPKKSGEYVARFQLTANGHTLDGGILELPLTVTADAPDDYQELIFAQPSGRELAAEPNIRVGLYKTGEPVKFSSDFQYNVYAGTELKGTLPAGENATLKYQNSTYYFTGASLKFSSDDFIRLAPDDINSYFTLVNYERRVSWKGNKNFNVYRGVMEYKYSAKSDLPYVVNELPLDLYVAGIGETSGGAAMEYIKAMLVAARSYAYYNINNGLPAEKRIFDVYATTVDQLYLGYNSELFMPRVAQAQQVTYGEMATYNGAPVTTPYFAHSDGNTRLWSEAWGGTDKPWLQSVECFYDTGKSLYGHGVGISMQDAAARADKDAWTYDQILKYYYTGVEVEKIY